jgi:hypothetical protein
MSTVSINMRVRSFNLFGFDAFSSGSVERLLQKESKIVQFFLSCWLFFSIYQSSIKHQVLSRREWDRSFFPLLQ